MFIQAVDLAQQLQLQCVYLKHFPSFPPSLLALKCHLLKQVRDSRSPCLIWVNFMQLVSWQYFWFSAHTSAFVWAGYHALSSLSLPSQEMKQISFIGFFYYYIYLNIYLLMWHFTSLPDQWKAWQRQHSPEWDALTWALNLYENIKLKSCSLVQRNCWAG